VFLIAPISLDFEVGYRKVKRTQLPMLEAFAITVHKSQSLTLQKAVVDCGTSMFSAGMAYTALSRVRKLEDLILLNLDVSQLFRTNSIVCNEYRRLEGLHPPGPENNWATTLISESQTISEVQLDDDSDNTNTTEQIDEIESLEQETFEIPE